jgi:hypothetical protein
VRASGHAASQPETYVRLWTAKPSVPHFPPCCATRKRVAGSKAAFYYNDNGIYRSLGNVLVNQSVTLLFIDFERPRPCDARSDYGRRQFI